jgi:hypothetical protein
MWSWPKKIQADPVRPTTQGRATRALAPRQAADGRTRDPVRRLRQRHASLPPGLQSAYSRLGGSHLNAKSRPADT